MLTLLLSLAVRVAILVPDFASLDADPDGYRAIAENVVQNHSVARSRAGVLTPTAYRPPLYPTVLASIAWDGQLRPLAVAVLHVLLGAATVFGVLLLAANWKLGRWSYLAAALVAVDPILLKQSTVVMTETLAAFLCVMALLAITRYFDRANLRHAAIVGLSLGVCTLCRPTFIVWSVMVILLMLCRREKSRWMEAAVSSAVVIAALAPWAIRNQIQFGKPIFLTTHGGYTLWLGNNPEFIAHLRGSEKAAWKPQAFMIDWQVLCRWNDWNEVEIDQEAYARAVGACRADPAGCFLAAAYRLSRLWGVAPQAIASPEPAAQRMQRLLVSIWYGALLLAAVVWLIALANSSCTPAWSSALLACLAFSLVHLAYWCDLRMRAPLAPILCLLAAWGLSALFRWRRRSAGENVEAN